LAGFYLVKLLSRTEALGTGGVLAVLALEDGVQGEGEKRNVEEKEKSDEGNRKNRSLAIPGTGKGAPRILKEGEVKEKRGLTCNSGRTKKVPSYKERSWKKRKNAEMRMSEKTGGWGKGCLGETLAPHGREKRNQACRQK